MSWLEGAPVLKVSDQVQRADNYGRPEGPTGTVVAVLGEDLYDVRWPSGLSFAHRVQLVRIDHLR